MGSSEFISPYRVATLAGHDHLIAAQRDTEVYLRSPLVAPGILELTVEIASRSPRAEELQQDLLDWDDPATPHCPDSYALRVHIDNIRLPSDVVVRSGGGLDPDRKLLSHYQHLRFDISTGARATVAVAWPRAGIHGQHHFDLSAIRAAATRCTHSPVRQRIADAAACRPAPFGEPPENTGWVSYAPYSES